MTVYDLMRILEKMPRDVEVYIDDWGEGMRPLKKLEPRHVNLKTFEMIVEGRVSRVERRLILMDADIE